MLCRSDRACNDGLAGHDVIVLRPTNLHWIDGSFDDPADLCAHSPVEFRVGDVTLVAPTDGDWTVSAAAVFLLRTLSRQHTKGQPVAEHLFPCCGNGMFDVEGDEDVLIIGCNSGIDIEVVHVGNDVHLTSAGQTTCGVTVAEWSVAVYQFADLVQEFYAACSPKNTEDDADRAGFVKLTREWARRRTIAANEAASSSPSPSHFPLIERGETMGSSLRARVVQWFSNKHS